MEQAEVDPVESARAIVFRYISRDIFGAADAMPDAVPSDPPAVEGTWSPRAAAVTFLCILVYMGGIVWFVTAHSIN